MSDFILKSDSDFNYEISTAKSVSDYILGKVDCLVKNGKGELEAIRGSVTAEAFQYQDLRTLSGNVCSWLTVNGFKRGDTVLYSSHDGAKLHIFFLGVWQAGGIVRSSYPEDHGDDLIQKILESEVKWVFCDGQYLQENLQAIDKVPWNVQLIVAGEKSFSPSYISIDDLLNHERFAGYLPNNESRLDNLADAALILQTSGTTGNSKGVIYTHEQLLRNIATFERMPFMKEETLPFLLTSKLTHFTGSVIPLACLAATKRVIINNQPSVEAIKEDVLKYGVNGLMSFPKFFLSLCNDPGLEDMASLKFVVAGGQMMGPSFVDSIKKFPSSPSLVLVYGMTEVGILATSVDMRNPLEPIVLDDLRPFSCGKLSPGNELQIRDPNTEEVLTPGSTGEFYFRSVYAASGYYKRAEATRQIFKDGWVRTGDVGYYDRDGFIFLKGRTKDVFKYFNNHIWPDELENTLMKHPAVKDACVVGVPDPDGGDTVPRAYIVTKNGGNDHLESLLLDIKKFHDGTVASYKQLRGGVFALEKMPVGKTGKVLRSYLQTLGVSTP